MNKDLNIELNSTVRYTTNGVKKVQLENVNGTGFDLAGSIDIITSELGTAPSLSVGGIPIEDYIGNSTIVTAAGTKTLDEADNHVICVRTTGDSQDIDLVLPYISSLTTTKRYHISFGGDLRPASDTKDAYYVSISCPATIADITKGDTFDHIGKNSGSIWVCKHPITSQGSMVLQSVSNLNPGVGTTDGWVVVSSHFDKNKYYKDPVRLASTGNETLTDLIEGYSVDGKALQIHDRVLLKDQTTGAENGIYVIQQTDPPFRSKDLYDDSYASGINVPVLEGSTHSFKNFHTTNTTESSKINTDALTFTDSAGKSSWKSPVLIASTGSNLTLSGLQTIDGVLQVANDSILVKDQTNKAENGVYLASAGAWSRNAAWSSGSKVHNWSVWIQSGTTLQDTAWTVTNDTGDDTLGTHLIDFAEFSKAAQGSDTHVQFNSSGVLAGSSNLTWDGTDLQVNSIEGINASDNIDLFSDITSGTIFIGASQTTGDVKIGNTDIQHQCKFLGTNDTSSSTTGAVTIDGGLGVAKKVYVGDDVETNGDYIMTGFNPKITSTSATGDFIISSSAFNNVSLRSLAVQDLKLGDLNTTGSIYIGGAMTSGSINLGNSSQTGIVDIKSELRLSNKGSVTQITSSTTGVSLNKPIGVITTVNQALAGHGNVGFTVTNSYVDTTSIILLTTVDSSGSALLEVESISSGSFGVRIHNANSAGLVNTLKIAFVVL